MVFEQLRPTTAESVLSVNVKVVLHQILPQIHMQYGVRVQDTGT